MKKTITCERVKFPKGTRHCCVLSLMCDIASKKVFLETAKSIWNKRRYGKERLK